MTSIIDVFAPYLPDIVLILSIVLNLVFIVLSLRSQAGFSMVGFVIFNVIIALSTNLLGVIVPELSGYIEYDILTRIITLIGDLITAGLDEIMALFGI